MPMQVTSYYHRTNPDEAGYSLGNFYEIWAACFDAAGARSVIEVGAERGRLTQELLKWAAPSGAHVTAIEPEPISDLTELLDEYPDLEIVEETSLERPDVPFAFAIWPNALIGHDADILVPREETRPDWEGEVAVVIGRTTYRADRTAARAAIGGISAFNDVSGRRAQLETPMRQFTLGKSFDTFAPMGPCVVHPDGLDLSNIVFRTTLNGEVVQESDTSHLIFGFEELIEYFSKGVTLVPGDVIATGTPGGVGDERKPPRYLEDGEVIEVTVEGVGTLRNRVRKEA